MNLYGTQHYIDDFEKCTISIKNKIKNVEECLRQLTNNMAKDLLDKRRVKIHTIILETSIEKNPQYLPEEYCILMLCYNKSCFFLRVGTRADFIKKDFLLR